MLKTQLDIRLLLYKDIKGQNDILLHLLITIGFTLTYGSVFLGGPGLPLETPQSFRQNEPCDVNRSISV